MRNVVSKCLAERTKKRDRAIPYPTPPLVHNARGYAHARSRGEKATRGAILCEVEFVIADGVIGISLLPMAVWHETDMPGK